MTSSNRWANRQKRKTWAGLALSVCLLLSTPAITPAGIFGNDDEKGTKDWPQRDFLPPVANINPVVNPNAAQEDNEIEPVDLHAVSSPVIQKTPKVTRLDGYVSDKFKSDQVQNVLEIQRKIDEADLEYLWRATVEKNPVIRFSLEKLSAPPDLQPKQSSQFLRKTLSTMISGAALASSFVPGGGQYRDMGTMAAQNALQNLVSGRNKPTVGALSATEQIQMAGLIDELKMKLIQAYQNYKGTLQTLAESHQVTVKNNNLYSKALASKNDIAIMAAGTAYYQSLRNETTMRQKAKLNRMALERLAGREAVSQLELSARLDQIRLAVNSGPIGPEPEVGPAAPANTKGKATHKKNAKPASNIAMPNDLPQPIEIRPSLTSQVGPPEPISASSALPAASARNKTNVAAPKNDAGPLPIMPEILRHD